MNPIVIAGWSGFLRLRYQVVSIMGYLMKAVRYALFAVLLLGVSQASRAAEVPGASDLELRAAVQAWLDDDDPRQAMWAIGELAADGNVAARVLVNEVAWSLGRDFSEMTFEARRALLPPDRTG
ncbi:MAG: hypothetical protein AAGE83_17300, partial [Pseudomonadota bacterium]